VACQVPLWLALLLREHDVCKIVPPAWLSVGASTLRSVPHRGCAQKRTLIVFPGIVVSAEALTQTLAEEKANSGVFSDLPFYYQQIAMALLAG
jgi:hypothetical protein